MFGTALGGKLQTIHRSDVGFFLAPSSYFSSSHTSQQNVTEECFPLKASLTPALSRACQNVNEDLAKQ